MSSRNLIPAFPSSAASSPVGLRAALKVRETQLDLLAIVAAKRDQTSKIARELRHPLADLDQRLGWAP